MNFANLKTLATVEFSEVLNPKVQLLLVVSPWATGVQMAFVLSSGRPAAGPSPVTGVYMCACVGVCVPYVEQSG